MLLLQMYVTGYLLDFGTKHYMIDLDERKHEHYIDMNWTAAMDEYNILVLINYNIVNPYKHNMLYCSSNIS